MRYLLLILTFLTSSVFAQQLTEGSVVLGYAVSGTCTGFTQNGELIATSTGLYDVATGEIHTPFRGYPELSPDDRFVWVGEDGQYEFTSALYDVTSGERLLDFTGYGASFSPDGTMIAVNTDGIYDLATLEEKVDLTWEDWQLASPKFSPNSRYVIVMRKYTQYDVYDAQQGEYLYSVHGSPQFSSDGNLIVAEEDGIYETATGKKLLFTSSRAYLNADNTLVAVANDGLYDLATGEKRFGFGGLPKFSPDGQWVLLKEDAGGIFVYDLYDVNDTSGTRRFRTVATNGGVAFSPDSQVLLAGSTLYEVATGSKQLGFWENPEPAAFTFSADGSWVAIQGDGLYETASDERKFSFTGEAPKFNQDETLLLVEEDGIYETATGERLIDATTGLFGVRNAHFNADNTLVAFPTVDFYTQETVDVKCVIWGNENHEWPFRTGVAKTIINAESQPYGAPASKISLYNSPEGEVAEEAFWAGEKVFEILGHTADDKWLRVSENRWVRTEDVIILAFPDTIPVESGN